MKASDLARLHALHGTGTSGGDDDGPEGDDGAGLVQDLSDDPDAADYEQYRHQRRRSRAVLYHLSGSYDKTKNTKTKIQLNKVCHLIAHITINLFNTYKKLYTT